MKKADTERKRKRRGEWGIEGGFTELRKLIDEGEKKRKQVGICEMVGAVIREWDCFKKVPE